MMRRYLLILPVLSILWILFGCKPETSEETADVNRLRAVTFQSDWFAQPEYAGFYQALATGLYRKYGLDVTIVEGGPNADPLKRLLLKRCDFMNIRSDNAIVAYSRGMPIRFVGVTMQHNPQGILSHAENPITDFKQLDGKRVMVDVGAPWIEFIEKKFNITIIRMPHNFGFSHYLNDQSFIMQCFVTNEPYYVRKHGANPVVLPMWKSGFDVYRGILVQADFMEKNPEVVNAFVSATQEAWHDYLYGDPTPAHKLIAERNSQMTPDFMEFIRKSMIEYGIVDGQPNDPENIGKMDPIRLQEHIEVLFDLKVIEKKFEFSEVFPILPSSTTD
jgi:NitT/TauT family transport system substrate-binding protein